jgi:hypothetical protein
VKRPPKYPKLTPLKAFELLRELDYLNGKEGITSPAAVGRVRSELANHVRAAIVRGSR